MKLNLKKPLAFLDLETTGVNVATDRIVEISIHKVLPDGSTLTKTKRVNPVIPIPLQASLVHGIYDRDIVDEPTLKDLAKEIVDFLTDCDIAGYNSNRFDIPLLIEEFHRAKVKFNIDNVRFIDVQNIFHKMEKRTLEAAYKFYCDKDLTNAHSAEADTIATYEVLLGQLSKYEGELKNDTDFLAEFSGYGEFVDFGRRMVYNEDGEEVFNFGKYKGRLVKEVLKREPHYYDWMMKSEFPYDTKEKLKNLKLKYS